MTRNEPSEMDKLGLLILCPRCKSKPGRWCVTDAGRVAQYLHSGRLDPIYQAYGQGYIDRENEERVRGQETRAAAGRAAAGTDPWRA